MDFKSANPGETVRQRQGVSDSVTPFGIGGGVRRKTRRTARKPIESL